MTENTSKAATEVASNKPNEYGTGRDRVLDAYADLLRTRGPAAATLDAVARKAGISKGGLLHHFGSKDALIRGLLDRLRAEANADVTETIATSSDIVTSYLRSSVLAGDSVSQTLLAVMRLAGESDDVDSALQSFLNLWRDSLIDDIKDPIYARMVQLIGDGLYLHALVGNPSGEVDDAVIELVTQITEMVRARASDRRDAGQ